MFQIYQKDFYEHFNAKLNFTETENSHVWPVDKGDSSSKFPVESCAIMQTGPPNYSLVNCLRDLSGFILATLYEDLIPRQSDWQNTGVLTKYEHELVEGQVTEDGFSDDGGYIYYPNYCVESDHKCKVHIFLHGCDGGSETVGDNTVKYSGFLEYAASNNIIIAFP